MLKQLSLQPLFNSTNKKGKVALIIGQAPPEKNYEIPFSRTRLYHWFISVDITKEDAISFFDFDALVKSFPGKKDKGHIIPNDFEISEHIPSLIKKINENNFIVVIPVGKLAIQHTLNIQPDLKNIVGKEFFQPLFDNSTKATLVIPLPHPSGLSTWSFNESNKKQLHEALLLIKKHIV